MYEGHVDVVKFLLSEQGVDWDEKDRRGNSARDDAVHVGDPVKALFEYYHQERASQGHRQDISVSPIQHRGGDDHTNAVLDSIDDRVISDPVSDVSDE